MTEEIKLTILSLLKSAVDVSDATEAMKFSQAALNVAHVVVELETNGFNL